MEKMSVRIFVIALLFLGVTSCKKNKDNKVQEEKGNYFSIVQFTQDQWNTFHGQPFSFQKIKTENGKTDSSYVAAYDVDWGAIFKIFFESDISNKKYLGHYNFTFFDDDATATRTLYYEAKDKDLFTRTMQITVDPTTNKILSIFITTEKNTDWGSKSQKLYYAPGKVIQIQQHEKATTGPAKDAVEEYRFL